ncbi:MAG: hypothetical protein AAGA74_18050 [Pseudomonadota bacterium]
MFQENARGTTTFHAADAKATIETAAQKQPLECDTPEMLRRGVFHVDIIFRI